MPFSPVLKTVRQIETCGFIDRQSMKSNFRDVIQQVWGLTDVTFSPELSRCPRISIKPYREPKLYFFPIHFIPLLCIFFLLRTMKENEYCTVVDF